MPFHSIGEQYNPMEMLRGMMRPSAGGTDGKAGEDPTDKLIRWRMMNDLLKDAGGIGGMDIRPQARPPAPMMGVQPYAAMVSFRPSPCWRAGADQDCEAGSPCRCIRPVRVSGLQA